VGVKLLVIEGIGSDSDAEMGWHFNVTEPFEMRGASRLQYRRIDQYPRCVALSVASLRRCVRKKSLPNCTVKQYGKEAKSKSHATAQRRNVKALVMAGWDCATCHHIQF